MDDAGVRLTRQCRQCAECWFQPRDTDTVKGRRSTRPSPPSAPFPTGAFEWRRGLAVPPAAGGCGRVHQGPFCVGGVLWREMEEFMEVGLDGGTSSRATTSHPQQQEWPLSGTEDIAAAVRVATSRSQGWDAAAVGDMHAVEERKRGRNGRKLDRSSASRAGTKRRPRRRKMLSMRGAAIIVALTRANRRAREKCGRVRNRSRSATVLHCCLSFQKEPNRNPLVKAAVSVEL